MKKGYHTWPDSGKPHPVGRKHKKSGGYKKANNTYTEGK
jgi:hypothetical protein